MGDVDGGTTTAATGAGDGVGAVTVRYWAAARAAAGVASERVSAHEAPTLAALTALLTARDPGSRLARVLPVCSVVVGEQPVASREPSDVELSAGDTVEYLPPFAGG